VALRVWLAIGGADVLVEENLGDSSLVRRDFGRALKKMREPAGLTETRTKILKYHNV